MINITLSIHNPIELAEREKGAWLVKIGQWLGEDIPAQVYQAVGEQLSGAIRQSLAEKGLLADVAYQLRQDGESSPESLTLTIELRNALEFLERQIITQLTEELPQQLQAHGVQATLWPKEAKCPG